MKTTTLIASGALIASIFSAPIASAQTTPSTKQISCELMKVVAQDVISSRQEGQVMTAVGNRLLEQGWEYKQANSIAYQYLQKAYKVPVQLDDEAKQHVIQQFSNQAYEDCLCNWSAKPQQGI
ncbi:hypothetical protein [Thiomicrorhabdus sp. 6S3-12]|uniref:hypothetical protein n=1 Tax=Thiomicrorhabdus sp. 6S3-12 TaxID=2819681 RepID=UPI001AACAFA0|nr:hypothetical protein [Thiomicrorhabdus sp. 6S3-12]MBO1924460.1 hypothetical protein [Thiomicrorhabdus sp. 6S3-12]